MTSLRRLAPALLLLAVVTLACRPRPSEPAWEPPVGRGPVRVEVMRGTLHELRPGELSLVPCDRHVHLALVDRTGGPLAAARAALAPAAGATLFVEMRVERGVRSDDWRNDQDSKLVALELLRAFPVGEGDWCGTALGPGHVRASGNEPFWSVTIAPEGIEWREPELEAPLLFPAAAPVVEGASRTWTSTLPGTTPRTLRIVVTPSHCEDGMSGAWYPMRAEVAIDDRTMEGCAYGGE